MKLVLLACLAVETIVYAVGWFLLRRGKPSDAARGPHWPALSTGFVANFLDTLGIGSFATTTGIFRFARMVPDQLIPGTLNAGHAIPSIAQAFIFISAVAVDFATLSLMILGAVFGAWFGAGIVARWPRRLIQIGMGCALIAAALLMTMGQLQLFPVGGQMLGLTGIRLAAGTAGNFALGALMTIGIGLYAPCMILVSLLGMEPRAAFPIMMGSCAFLMPVSGWRFIRADAYHPAVAAAMAIGGVPAVLIAAFVVKSLPLTAVRWLVIVVVTYAAVTMLRAARERE